MVGLSRIAIALLACGVLAQPLSAQNDPGGAAPLDTAEAPFPYAEPEEVGLSSEALSDLADLVRGWSRDTLIVGAEILVVKDGRAVLHEAMGWSDLEAGEPMWRNSIFRLLALTKPFTGTAALMLVEDGRLELDAPVSRWLPTWADGRSGEVTVRQLLTHTAGWEQYGTPRPLESYPSLRAMVDDAGEHGPQHPPGQAYRYSDVNSYALGALVAEVSGMPVERFIEERILEHLDLDDTHTRFVPDTAWARRVNSRYRLEEGKWNKVWRPDRPQADPFFRASGGLFSTAMDYARWLEAWMGWIRTDSDAVEAGAAPVEDASQPGMPTSDATSPEGPRLLSRRTARAAVTPTVGPDGFHWEILSDDPLVFGHGGVDGTHAMVIPSRDLVVIYLSQSEGREMRDRWTRAALDAVAPGLDLHRPLASVPAERSGLDVVDLTPTQRACYAGRYRAGSRTVRIFEEGGWLQRRLPTAGAPAVALVPLGDHTFAMGRHEGDELSKIVLPLQRLRFVVEDGRATALELMHDGEERAVLQRLTPAADTVHVAPPTGETEADTVHVAPPTGETEADRASVQAAFDAVQPGGTVQFAAGTYLIGEIIPVPTPRVTLFGHTGGTTLCGCEPSAFGDRDFAVAECSELSLAGGHQTVRDLGSGNRVAVARGEAGPQALADRVTIYRDAYGVPHVHGETDAAAVFGYMYAQAEDAFPDVERAVARMTGRLAELEGEAAVSSDLYVRALETVRLSRADYARASPTFRRIAEAWAAGLNHYLDQNPEVSPRAIRRFEPWQMFAVAGRSESIWVPLGHGLFQTSEVGGAVDRSELARGSNMWMVGPAKSASGRAMLFINPHNAPETYLEGHLVSDEGLNVYGGHRPGRPLPVFGHTPYHGWAFTNNRPDVADLWAESFDHPTNPLAYRYGDGYRVAEEWTDTLRVRTDSATESREVTFRKTHHGPIVAVRDGVPLALRIARWEEGGTVQQFHAMARAQSFEEFRQAVARQREIWLNIGYADRDGNIWFVSNGAVPRRSPEFDWAQPVDGSDPRTEWSGYHDLGELPQVLNPEAGWLMNTNHSPFRVTAEGQNPDPADHPEYMARSPFGSLPVLVDSLGDNPRARASRRILARTDRFTFEAWADSTMSRRAWEADRGIPELVAAWERLRETNPVRAARLRPAVEVLRSWDHVSRHESVAMTLYTMLELTRIWSWAASLDPPPFDPPAVMDLDPTPWDRWDPMAGLEKVVDVLERQWGTWRVPYGEFSRLQRSPDGHYRDDRPSTPVLGGPGPAGMISLFVPFPTEGQKRWYGYMSGNSYVSVVDFGDEVRARTVNGSGQSFNPSSPHYTDQADLYGRGAYKRAWTTLEAVRARAVESYGPGDGR